MTVKLLLPLVVGIGELTVEAFHANSALRNAVTPEQWKSCRSRSLKRPRRLESPSSPQFHDVPVMVMAVSPDDGDPDFGSETSTSMSDSTVELGGGDGLPEEAWRELEESQPSEWMIMKDLLGINAFTYVIAAAIFFFLSMNTFLGPGWLGSSFGIQGTGEFTETSTSLPDMVDLGSDKDYLL